MIVPSILRLARRCFSSRVLVVAAASFAVAVIASGCASTDVAVARAGAAGETSITDEAIAAIGIRSANADYPVPTPVSLIALHSDGEPLLLETSSVRTASVAALGAWQSGSDRVSIGAELAPMLIGDAIDLSEYLSSRLLRLLVRTRISYAADISSRDRMRHALGVRWMLHDDADLRADSTLALTVLRSPAARRAIVLDSARRALEERFWNRSVWEVAMTTTMRTTKSADDVSTDVEAYQAFFGSGWPIVDGSLQLQAGATFTHNVIDSAFAGSNAGSLAARAVVGTSSERMFIGMRFVAAERFAPDYLAEIGALIRIANGLWIRPDLAFPLIGNWRRGPRASVTVSFGTPELR